MGFLLSFCMLKLGLQGTKHSITNDTLGFVGLIEMIQVHSFSEKAMVLQNQKQFCITGIKNSCADIKLNFCHSCGRS